MLNRTQIELMQKDGSLIELSKASQLVSALTGQGQGDVRFYYPKEMTQQDSKNSDLFDDYYQAFANHIRNGALIE